MAKVELQFPKSFLWGAATSAHQVEGGNHNNWTIWELENAKVLAKAAEYKIGHLPVWPEIKKLASTPDNYVSGRAIDHYNRYEEDFDLMQKMHLNAFRFSIEWSRIEPEEGAWNVKEIEHYKQYIAALKKRGLEPMVTLYHWTVPVWFARKGAFEKASNIQYFVWFAEKILEELGKDLTFITSVNEPDTVAGHGYYLQEHPPAVRSPWKVFWVYRNHLKAHKEVYDMAKKRSRRFKVGFVKSYSAVRAGDDSRLSRFMAWGDRLVRDRLVLRYVGRKTAFIGANYYFSDAYKGLKIVNESDYISDLGWEMHPENILLVLRSLARYKRPIFVMENGLADRNDAYRKDWLTKTITAVQSALKEGVDVRGYLHWSAFDNFEWAYGRWPSFGLVEIEYENDFKRVIRPSGRYYAAVVKKIRGV